jgi:hypothetical protein
MDVAYVWIPRRRNKDWEFTPIIASWLSCPHDATSVFHWVASSVLYRSGNREAQGLIWIVEGQDIPTCLWGSRWQCFGMHMAFFSSWAMWKQGVDADARQNWGHWRKQSGQITHWVHVSYLLGINGLCFGQTNGLIWLTVVWRNRGFCYLLLFGKSSECNIPWDVTYWMPAGFHIRGSEAARSGSVQLAVMWKMLIVSCGKSVWLFGYFTYCSCHCYCQLTCTGHMLHCYTWVHAAQLTYCCIL